MALPRALTGIQPSGVPHIGNLKGMVEPAVRLQETHDTFYFVASYHAMTTTHDAETLLRNQRVAALTFLAFGLDPSRCTLFLQQSVPEVCELAWILSCHTNMGLLERAHAFKAARDAHREINLGTLSYPVLMAADILLYHTHVVPVGKDQKQHVEMARDMAMAFNHLYGEVFTLPQAVIKEDVATVPGLDGRKMSKSYGNAVEPFLPPKDLRKRLMQVVTDSKGLEEPKDPETCNVFALYKLFSTPDQQQALADRYRAGNFGYGHAKQELFEVMNAALEGPRARYEELAAQPQVLDQILSEGAEKARTIARSTMRQVRSVTGLDRLN